ncbi:MAG: putative quinol monooxygenase [Gemmatirosa sp.]
MIHVIAEISLRPGARDAFVAEFQRLTPLVRAEDGCLEYQGALEIRTGLTAQAPVRDDVLTVVEKWRDEAALAAHLDAPHMHDHRERSRDLASGVTVRVLRSV